MKAIYQLSNHPDSGKGFQGGGEVKSRKENNAIEVYNERGHRCIIIFRFIMEEFDDYIEIELKTFDAEEFIDNWNCEIRDFLEETYSKKVDYKNY